MSKHVVIEFDPSAPQAWNRCAIRDLFSYGDVDLKQLVAEQLNQPGHYLVKVSVSVEVIEHQPLHAPEVLARETEFGPQPRDYLANLAA